MSSKIVSFFIKVWKDPVWSASISAGIVAIAGVAFTYYSDIYLKTVDLYNSIIKIASTPSGVQNWIIWLLVLFLVVFLMMLVFIFSLTIKANDWKNYTEDNFLNVKWRWNYNHRNQIYNLTSYCPKCDFQIFPNDVSPYNYIAHIKFDCDHCGADLPDFQESASSLQNKIVRTIEQRIRNNQWIKQ